MVQCKDTTLEVRRKVIGVDFIEFPSCWWSIVLLHKCCSVQRRPSKQRKINLMGIPQCFFFTSVHQTTLTASSVHAPTFPFHIWELISSTCMVFFTAHYTLSFSLSTSYDIKRTTKALSVQITFVVIFFRHVYFTSYLILSYLFVCGSCLGPFRLWQSSLKSHYNLNCCIRFCEAWVCGSRGRVGCLSGLYIARQMSVWILDRVFRIKWRINVFVWIAEKGIVAESTLSCHLE